MVVEQIESATVSAGGFVVRILSADCDYEKISVLNALSRFC